MTRPLMPCDFKFSLAIARRNTSHGPDRSVDGFTDRDSHRPDSEVSQCTSLLTSKSLIHIACTH